MRLLLAGIAFACLTLSAMGQGSACKTVEQAKTVVAAHGAQWIELTHEQWQYLRGIYSLDPETPPGLPFGDKAALARMGDIGGIIFFIDGEKACTPMKVPKKLVDMINQVGEGFINHEGNGT